MQSQQNKGSQPDIATVVPANRIHRDIVLRTAFAVDASLYERIPEAVVDLADEEEVRKLFAYARATGTGITFRGSGTSLNGQCSGTGILARLRGSFWHRLTIDPADSSFQAWNGMLGSEINDRLQPYGVMMGPDPASQASATFGGIICNNAAGMCCTVDQNAYATLKGMRLMLADGTILDTTEQESVAAFRQSHADLLAALLAIRNEVLAQPALVARIKKKYRIKNTCGYSINALVDFADPIDILTHLIVGSEGTLGFVSNASLTTISCLPYRATALIFFPSLRIGTQAVSRWLATDAAGAAELFDGLTLQAMANLPIAPAIMQNLDPDACAVLIEAQTAEQATLAEKIELLTKAVEDLPTLSEYQFYTDEETCASLWALRRALFPAVAGNRKAHESVLIEDICLPLEAMEEGCQRIGELLAQHGFVGGLHGHAFHGNFHFAIPVDLSTQAEQDRLHTFLKEMMAIIVELDGSLKAEHGTGYTIAPFVSLEWGTELHGIMQRVKTLCDPQHILNPGVLINDDPHCHTKNIRIPTATHPLLDRCVNCGFCEPVCPSAKIAISPRQHVALSRTISRLRQQNPAQAKQWQQTYDRIGIDLCATDGLCMTRCPMAVDIAGYVRERRGQSKSTTARRVARTIGCNMAAVTKGTAHLLNGVALLQQLMGDAALGKTAEMLRTLSAHRIPAWNPAMPKGGTLPVSPATVASRKQVVYIPSCAVRTMGDSVHTPLEPLPAVTIRVLERAGYSVILPEQLDSLCCGKAFETKGLLEMADQKSQEMEAALLAASRRGQYPILCETSPCLARMRKVMDSRLQLFEPIAFAQTFLINRLQWHQRLGKVAIHPTCSTRALGLAEPFYALAVRCAQEVIWPRDIFCCGFSGDKGFSRPELNAAALSHLAQTIAGCETGYSTSRTCEIGLSLHGKVPYQNIMYLLDACTEALEPEA